ncbi:MAG: nucleotidyltransferase domain-containing protein, partial [Candidatus Omnitrophota bacterium]
HDILKFDIIGRQHIYRLNFSNRIVKEMLEPVFKKERAVKEDVIAFLNDKISEYKVRNIISSLILYGSLQSGQARQGSDCDIAVVVKDKPLKERLEGLFIDKISGEFSKYFGIHLDAYIKTKDEFIGKLKKNLPPVSALMNSYTVIYGQDPKGLK